MVGGNGRDRVGLLECHALNTLQEVQSGLKALQERIDSPIRLESLRKECGLGLGLLESSGPSNEVIN